MPGWTDPFDPDRTGAGPGGQWSDPPADESRPRVGRHRAPEPFDDPDPVGRGGEPYRPVLDDPPRESPDREPRRPSRPVVLGSVAAAATLAAAVAIAGLLMPGDDRAPMASGADGNTAAATDPGTAGGEAASSFEGATGSPAERASDLPSRSARVTPAPTRPTEAVASPTRTATATAPRTDATATATPRHGQATATATPARPATASPAPSLALQVVSLVNQERTGAGCRPLTVDSTLTRAARLHSEDQAAQQEMSHTGSDGSSLGQRIDRVGYRWRTLIGENVAYGQATPAQVMNDWMNSDGHRRNILNCQFEDIGVGVAKDADGQLVWTQDFGA